MTDKSHYEVLDVAETATYVDIDEAYRRALDLIRGESVGGYLMLDEEKMQEAIDEVEAAYAVLKDPDARAAFDNERGIDSVAHKYSPKTAEVAPLRFLAPVFEEPAPDPPGAGAAADHEVDDEDDEDDIHFSGIGAEPPPRSASSPPFSILPPVDAERDHARRDSTPPQKPAPRRPSRPPADNNPTDIGPVRVVASAEPAPALPEELSAEFNGASEVNGQLIRELREARGLTVDDVAKKTHIQRKFLVAIEEMDFAELPRRVYLRGFLTQIARVLRVDKKTLATGYMTLLERFDPDGR